MLLADFFIIIFFLLLFFFPFVTYIALFSSMTKQHRQDPAPGLPACAMIQQVVKGRNVFFFGKGWERNGKRVCVCACVHVCVCIFDFLVVL